VIPSEEDILQSKLVDIQKKTGNKFSINEIKREYELNEKDEKKTLINLLKQKGFLLQNKMSLIFFFRGRRSHSKEKLI